jgi:Icc-related predicted phosphoesterase
VRILHVSDLHSDGLWFDWLANTCGKFDLLVISGDLLDMFSKVALVDQAKAVRNWMLKLSTPIVVCSGNHDYWISTDQFCQARWISDLKRTDRRKHILGVDGDVIEFGGLRIGVKGWLGQNPEEPIDVLVTHAPPSGTPCASSANGRHDNGDQDLWDLEFAPRWILCGHIHDPACNQCVWPLIDPTTVVLNTGFDGHAEIPNHWVIDTAKNVHVFRGAIQD